MVRIYAMMSYRKHGKYGTNDGVSTTSNMADNQHRNTKKFLYATIKLL